MKKKALAALLVTAMVLSTAACGSGTNTSSESGSNDSAAADSTSKDVASADSTASAETSADSTSKDAASTDDPWANIDTSEHVVITYMVTGEAPSGEKLERYNEMMGQLNAILTEKVNAELETYFISWTDYLSNYNLALAQMDGSIDLVGTASDWLDAWPNAKNGAFLELSEEMLQTYAPKTWASVPAENWEMCKYNGEIYLMPEDNYAQWTNCGFLYRLDWAKEAGLSDGVNSWEDLTVYWQYVREAYSDIIPWDSDGESYNQDSGGWLASHTNFVSIDGITAGALWGGTKDDLYTIYCPYAEETDLLVEFAKMMKEWDEIGVWRTDVLNNKSATTADDYKVGNSAGYQKHTQEWTGTVSHTAANKIYEMDEDAETGFFYFGKETGNVVALSITHGAMAVSAASKNPERALMVYDLLRNDAECYKLFCYGIEGVSYEITDDGLRTNPEGYNQDTDNINGITNYWWGRNDDLEIPVAEYDWDVINALYDEYDRIKIEYPYGQFVADVDNIQSYISNIAEIHTNYMKQIAYGKYNGTAEEIVAEYQAALKSAGVDIVTEELQRQFDELYGN